jgi:hypothetical protein
MGAMVVQSWFAPVRCYAFSPFYWSFIAALFPLFTGFSPLFHSYLHFLCRIDKDKMETPIAQ